MADISVCGRLTKDPETRQVKDQTFVRFALADGDYFRKTKDGQSQTIFFDCEAWGQSASTVERFCTKGSRLKVAGQLSPNWWTNKNGETVKAQTLRVDRVMLLDRKEDKGSNSFDSLDRSSNNQRGSLSLDEIPF